MKNPIHSIRDYWNRNITKPLFTSAVILILAVVILVVIDMIFKPGGISFWDNIFAELHGMLFDVAIILFLFNWIESKRDKKLRIERYKEEIEDFRQWKNEEAMHRIRGLIRRLNEEGITNLNLHGAYLRKADLTGAKLQGANLIGANLQNASFRWANLKGAYIRDAHLEGARLLDTNLELFQLKAAYLADNSDFIQSPTIMMDGTKYDESWAERINQSWEAHERESGTPSGQ